MREKIRFFIISTLSISLVLSQKPYNQYEIYEIEVHDAVIPQSQGNGYQGNPFLSNQPSNSQSNNNVGYVNPSARSYVQPLQPPSCDNFFSYEEDLYGKTGLIKIPDSNWQKSVLKLLLSVSARLTSRYVGEVSLAKDKQSAVNDISNGLPLLYRVRFPVQNPVPKVTGIYYNDKLICTGPRAVGQFVTTIQLDHTFLTGLNHPPYRPSFDTTHAPHPTQRPQPPPTQRPVPSWIPPQTTSRPPPTRPPPVETRPPSWLYQTTQRPSLIPFPSPDLEDKLEIDDECGVPEYRAPTTTGLTIGGTRASRGQFPWLAAYYHNGPGDSGFICGGSLVSAKVIVTAAHCIQYKKDPARRKAEEASFYIGKHNLESLNSEKNYIVSGVSQFIIHPDWDHNDDRYDADLAVAILYRTVPFSKFIKPICLWTSTKSHSDIVGQNGIVAGWGKTEFDAISTSTPNWIQLPVVDLLTCIRSNDAFNQLTSDRTFCAGDRVGGTGPCSGDSGGGFVMQSGNKWYLRGVVSSALYDKVLSTCDTKNYAVFTDTAKYTIWLQQQIRVYG